MPTLMIQGCSSWAGKTLVATALARILVRKGLHVAPFKALNMANNARVVDGGEIASAQYFQALAARVAPDVRMNPVLVKPESETRSQVVLLGKVDVELSRTPWRSRTEKLWPVIEQSFRSLEAEVDLVIAEGAGSPAEFNLWDTDVANMRVAELAEAAVLLVADIDRGGSFAHLLGTWALLPPHQRALIHGFVLNKFRGDPALVGDAPRQLERMTGVPTLGLIPFLHHQLPDEDGANPDLAKSGEDRPVVAVIRYPTASNLDEFKPLEHSVRLRWAWRPADLSQADLVVLPGSKHVVADLAWLREHGFAEVIRSRIEADRPVLAICGGLQMLGQRISDDEGVDGSAIGLGMLPLKTWFEADKITRLTDVRFRSLPKPWSALSGLQFSGYQIRHGKSVRIRLIPEAIEGGLGHVQGPVLATYVHGMFEEPAIRAALFGDVKLPTLDRVLDDLADAVERALNMPAIEHLLQGPAIAGRH
jgi:adenosylcobyric acid synthase